MGSFGTEIRAKEDQTGLGSDTTQSKRMTEKRYWMDRWMDGCLCLCTGMNDFVEWYLLIFWDGKRKEWDIGL
uniref:Uncharacterized protein n=1 Tax=Onchocerca volvulus TaxID=6282 RepID=A0A8R1XZD6_ONCVO